LDTASARATFGEDVVEAVTKEMGELFLNPSSVAKVCVALSSGLLDAVTGQVIVADEGWSLVGPITFITRRGSPGSFPKKAVEQHEIQPVSRSSGATVRG
jgi:hypothetical protein